MAPSPRPRPGASRLFGEDYDSSIVTALEAVKEDGTLVKAPFLLGRSIGKPAMREVKIVGDALAVSLDERRRLDLDDVARRIGLSRDDTIEALGMQVYQTPQGELELAAHPQRAGCDHPDPQRIKLIGVREESIAPIRERMIGELEDELGRLRTDAHVLTNSTASILSR